MTTHLKGIKLAMDVLEVFDSVTHMNGEKLREQLGSPLSLSRLLTSSVTTQKRLTSVMKVLCVC